MTEYHIIKDGKFNPKSLKMLRKNLGLDKK